MDGRRLASTAIVAYAVRHVVTHRPHRPRARGPRPRRALGGSGARQRAAAAWPAGAAAGVRGGAGGRGVPAVDPAACPAGAALDVRPRKAAPGGVMPKVLMRGRTRRLNPVKTA